MHAKVGRRASRTSATQLRAMSEKQFESFKEDCSKVALAGLCGAALLWGSPAIADLNKYEAAAGSDLPSVSFAVCPEYTPDSEKLFASTLHAQ